MKITYHQVPIKEFDKPFTAYEVNCKLYEFNRIPFGVSNGVAVFQRNMNEVVTKGNLKDTFIYLDYITIAGKTQEDLDLNVKKFLEIAEGEILL